MEHDLKLAQQYDAKVPDGCKPGKIHFYRCQNEGCNYILDWVVPYDGSPAYDRYMADMARFGVDLPPANCPPSVAWEDMARAFSSVLREDYAVQDAIQRRQLLIEERQYLRDKAQAHLQQMIDKV